MEATRISISERGPATSPLARSSAATSLVESSHWAANLAVVLRCGRLCLISFCCIPCDFFGDDRCAAGEFSGDDHCMAGAGPPARGLYKGVVCGGVPPPHCSFAFLASEKSLSALFAFAFCCPRAFRLSACVSRLGCCRGGFLFRLRPNSLARLFWTLSPPSRR